MSVLKIMKNVLLDFDGVVYNNKNTFKHINHKSTCYVAKHKNIPYSKAATINKCNYVKNGHTTFTTNTTVMDYNNFVFDSNTIDDILYINYNGEDTYRLRQLKEIKERNELNLILCTNAPLYYCERILELSGMTLSDLFSTQHCFTSDRLQCVKPSDQFFNHIQTQLDCQSRHVSFYDDSMLNIYAARLNIPNMKSFIFNPNDVNFEMIQNNTK